MHRDILYPLRWLHGAVAEGPERLRVRRSYQKRFRQEIKDHKNCVFLVMTPEYTNLGDHALAIAEKKFLEALGFYCLEITGRELGYMRNMWCLSLMNGHPIILTGGGYIGTIWPETEILLRDVMRHNPRSTIFMLPNSAYYENSPWGEAELRQSRQVYGNHKHLHIFAREKKSLDFLQKHFSNIKLAPDMVLSCRFPWEKRDRSGCILCLREDVEKTRSPEQEQSVRMQAEELFRGNIRILDMETREAISPACREQAVEKQMQAFAGAELVITDRLHGMIFCAITGTPCIVLDSMSPKVRGCYAWISELPYIRFLDGKKLEEVYEEIPEQYEIYNPDTIQPLFAELKQDLIKFCKENP